jgi:type IV pilus assembly protein PilA
MFQRFHEMKERREGGFTLIELLVVILIIAILAAIAIPVFLKQREKAWKEQVESALKNSATAQESYSTDNNGLYATDISALTGEGLKYSADDVEFDAVQADGSEAYCMEAHSLHKAEITGYYWSADGRPTMSTSGTVNCPADLTP